MSLTPCFGVYNVRYLPICRQLEENINKWTLDLEDMETTFLNQATQVQYLPRNLPTTRVCFGSGSISFSQHGSGSQSADHFWRFCWFLLVLLFFHQAKFELPFIMCWLVGIAKKWIIHYLQESYLVKKKFNIIFITVFLYPDPDLSGKTKEDSFDKNEVGR